MHAQLGRDDTLRAAAEQRAAQFPLDSPQLRREAGLRDVQRGGRAADAAGFSHGEHDPQVAQTHIHFLPPSVMVVAGNSR
jgi:hypothetical protein